MGRLCCWLCWLAPLPATSPAPRHNQLITRTPAISRPDCACCFAVTLTALNNLVDICSAIHDLSYINVFSRRNFLGWLNK